MATFVKIDERAAFAIAVVAAVVIAFVVAPDQTMGVVNGVLGGLIDLLEGMRAGVTG